MNILVTGGAGFIGRYVCANLINRGHKVMVYDYAKPDFKDVIFCSGCVQDRAKLYSCIENSDAVIHLAGVLGTAETVDNPFLPIDVNITGSTNVFEACRKLGKKGVYIAVGNHFMNNSYSITKTTAERFALMYNAEHGTKIAIVRGLNVYGPRQKAKPVRKVIPNFVLPAIKNEPITIYGSGEQVMDFIYASDAAEVLCRALLDDHGVYDRIFEAGSGDHTTINHIAETIVKLAGSKSEIIHEPMRAGETNDSVVVADTSTLEHLRIKASDFISLETGLKMTIEYYKRNLAVYL